MPAQTVSVSLITRDVPIGNRVNGNRLMATTALSAALVGILYSNTPAQAGCLVIGDGIPCTGTLDETVNAGPNNNIIFVDGATGALTVNGQGGQDAIAITGSSLSAKSTPTLVDGGTETDFITIQGASSVTGNLLGGTGNDSLLVEGGSTVTGNIDGEADDDYVAIRGGSSVTGNLIGGLGSDSFRIYKDAPSEAASTLTGDIQGGAGADSVYLQDAATVTGNVLGEQDDDLIIVQGGATVSGDVDGGTGADRITVQGGSTIRGHLFGRDGIDAMVVEGASAISGTVDGGEESDTIMLRGASTVGGSVLGGFGDDTITVNDASVTGVIDGGNDDDTISVIAGTVRGGIAGSAGNDTVTLYGGTIAGIDGGDAISMGTGNDLLDIINLGGSGTAALNISGITQFDGEAPGGRGADVARIVDMNGSYLEGGLFNRTFSGWSEVYAIRSLVELDGDNTISALSITLGSTLFQTDGKLALLDAAGSDTASLTVDSTSMINMQDGAFASLQPSQGSTSSQSPSMQAASSSAASPANDSITVANLRLTGQSSPLSHATLGIDFDADNETNQNPRDHASSGSADHIDVTSAITLISPVGIAINATGGYRGSGLPVSLSGSVAIVDDLSSSALANPGINATLESSTHYVTNDLFSDPARRWALVDQGVNGVALQWTTPINSVTMGPNAEADLAVAVNTSNLLSGLMTGLADNSLLRRGLCIQPTADVSDTDCQSSRLSMWIQGGGGWSSFGSMDGFAGFDTSSYDLAGGIEYALEGDTTVGVFGAYQNGSADLGKVDGAFGNRSSSADMTAGFGGAYLTARHDGLYFNGIGILGGSHTDLTNGALLNADSDYNGWVGGFGATAGAVLDVGSNFAVDPRLQASYLTTSTNDNHDSYGLGVNSGSGYGRASATLGLIYGTGKSPINLALRGGGALVSATTTVNAKESGSGSKASVELNDYLAVLTGSIDVSWKAGERATLIGSVSGDTGQELQNVRGDLTLSYSFE